MKLNEIQRGLKHHAQKIKLEKQKLKELKDKVRKETKALEAKQ
jgi:hypothetical protein